MTLPDDIRPDDRVLVIGIPDPDAVAMLARTLSQGLLVAIGDEETVRSARKAARDLDNVMLLPFASGELPWRDGFFTRVLHRSRAWENQEKLEQEIRRVTAGGADQSNGA